MANRKKKFTIQNQEKFSFSSLRVSLYFCSLILNTFKSCKVRKNLLKSSTIVWQAFVEVTLIKYHT